MFNRKEKAAAREALFQELLQKVDAQTIQFEKAIETALTIKDDAEKLLAFMQIKRDMDHLQDHSKDTVNKTSSTMNNTGNMAAVTTLMGSAIMGFVGLFSYESLWAASLFTPGVATYFIVDRAGKVEEKRRNEFLKRIEPLTVRLETAYKKVDVSIKLTKENNRESIRMSPSYPDLVKAFPRLTREFGDAVSNAFERELRATHFKKDKTPELNKPKSMGVGLPKKKPHN